MIIERNGMTFELTDKEMFRAHKECEMAYTIQDVKEYLNENKNSYNFTEEEIKDIALTALDGLANDDYYFEIYWSAIECAVKYAKQ